METENAFFRALERTRGYRVRGRVLELMDDMGRVSARLEEGNLR
jgi:heat shock protein HslJ